MSDAHQERVQAAQLPDGDVIKILLEQHARIRELFAEVSSATGDAKSDAFDTLRALLAVHETAEEMILRPVTEKAGGESVAKARNDEEAEANEVLKALEGMDVTSAEFDAKLTSFEKSVSDHAESEETEEFPTILSSCDADERAKMGQRLQRAESIAPTHPHPSAAGSPKAQKTLGPFASLVDRARDALS